MRLEFVTDAVSYFTRQRVPIFLLCLCIVTVPVHLQTDMELVCDETWDLNTEVSMTCTILTANYPSKCVTPPVGDIVQFRVGAGLTERCSASISPCNQPRPSSPGCACYENNGTHYTLEYRLTVTESDTGTWDCYISCLNGFFPALSTTNDRCGSILNKICEGSTLCQNGGTCINNSSASGNHTCICPPDYYGENCEHDDHSDGCNDDCKTGIGAGVGACVVAAGGGVAGYAAYCYFKGVYAKCCKCGKWRRLRMRKLKRDKAKLRLIFLPDGWECKMNPDTNYNACAKEMDPNIDPEKLQKELKEICKEGGRFKDLNVWVLCASCNELKCLSSAEFEGCKDKVLHNQWTCKDHPDSAKSTCTTKKESGMEKDCQLHLWAKASDAQ